MTLDELRGSVEDVLALPLSDSQTIEVLLARVNGVDPKHLLAAALAVAREQSSEKIAELERALDDSEDSRDSLEDEMQELWKELEQLLTKHKRT